MILLMHNQRLYILENQIPITPDEDADREVRNTYQNHIDDDDQVVYVMLVSMTPRLQRHDENMDAHTMIMHLKELFNVTNTTERYETSKEFSH